MLSLVPRTTPEGDGLRGDALIDPTLLLPGTQMLRTSILALWADTTAGRLVMELMAPRVPVTVELDVHTFGPLPGEGPITVLARPLKTGRSITVVDIAYLDAAGTPVATGGLSFMAAPDPGVLLEGERLAQARVQPPPGPPSTVPLLERTACARRQPGVATLSRADGTINASDTLNGGLLALAIEEAVLSLDDGQPLASMSMRYLRPVRTGPAVATAIRHGNLYTVQVRDEGAEQRLAIMATARPEPSGGKGGRIA